MKKEELHLVRITWIDSEGNALISKDIPGVPIGGAAQIYPAIPKTIASKLDRVSEKCAADLISKIAGLQIEIDPVDINAAPVSTDITDRTD
ncbi:MAG: hypothetical protein WC541_07530 [Dehalococcoidia bacterium]